MRVRILLCWANHVVRVRATSWVRLHTCWLKLKWQLKQALNMRPLNWRNIYTALISNKVWQRKRTVMALCSPITQHKHRDSVSSAAASLWLSNWASLPQTFHSGSLPSVSNLTTTSHPNMNLSACFTETALLWLFISALDNKWTTAVLCSNINQDFCG